MFERNSKEKDDINKA